LAAATDIEEAEHEQQCSLPLRCGIETQPHRDSPFVNLGPAAIVDGMLISSDRRSGAFNVPLADKSIPFGFPSSLWLPAELHPIFTKVPSFVY
jgi:hypothetical protein